MSGVSVEELVAVTRARLGGLARRVVPPGPLVRAAVLVPIIDRGEAHLVFAKRTDRVGHHAGQISFPGGRVDPGDADDLAAALREAQEEVGLAPAAVEPLGLLDDTETFATQFVITPWVGLVRGPVVWQPDGEEIEKVIEVPVAALLDRGSFRVERWERDGVARDIYFYDYQDETIWASTWSAGRDGRRCHGRRRRALRRVPPRPRHRLGARLDVLAVCTGCERSAVPEVSAPAGRALRGIHAARRRRGRPSALAAVAVNVSAERPRARPRTSCRP